jgi:hypothetical protein
MAVKKPCLNCAYYMKEYDSWKPSVEFLKKKIKRCLEL